MGVNCGHCTPHNLKTRIREEAINLIENEGVDTFLVGEKGGYEIDAYDVVSELQEEYPDIQIILVISAITDLHAIGGVYNENCIFRRRGFDDFILPPRCEHGYKRLSIVYRNRYVIENTDFIIAYNKYEGRAFEFCKAAKGKGVKVIELAEV